MFSSKQAEISTKINKNKLSCKCIEIVKYKYYYKVIKLLFYHIKSTID